MKLWQAFVLIWLSFLVVVGSGGSPAVATAAPHQAGGLSSPSRGPLPGPARAAPQAGDYAVQLVALVNAQRAAAGLSPLVEDARLDAAASTHNYSMSELGCFAHVCPGEGDPTQRMRAAGYRVQASAENIGAGYQTPQEMITGWMGSPGHRANVLGNYTDIGCAYLRVGSAWDTYWTCDFAAGDSRGPGPRPSPTPTPRTPPPTALEPWRVTVTLDYGVTLQDVMTLVNLCKLAHWSCAWTPPRQPWPNGAQP